MLQMDTIARRVCPNAGGDASLQENVAGGILRAPRNYFRTDALDRIHRQVTEFSQYERPDQAMGGCLLELEGLRREAAAKMTMGGSFPDASVSVLRAQDAPPFRNGKSIVLASVQGLLDCTFAAKQTRRLLEPGATDSDMESDGEDLPY